MNRTIGLICFLLLFVGTTSSAQHETQQFRDLAWSPDGTLIAGVMDDGSVNIWSIDNLYDPIMTFQPELARTVQWYPDSQHVAIQGSFASEDDALIRKQVTKWDVSTGTLVETLFSFEMDTSYEFNPYGYIKFPTFTLTDDMEDVAYSFLNNSIYISDGTSVLRLENLSEYSHIYMMRWSPDEEKIAAVYGASDIYNIQIIDVETREVNYIIHQDMQYFVAELDWSANSEYLAITSVRFNCCSSYTSVSAYSMDYEYQQQWAPENSWAGGEQHAASIEWHPTESYLAIAQADAVRVFNLFDEEPLFEIVNIHPQDISWSPDGTQIAVGLEDGILEIHEVSITEN